MESVFIHQRSALLAAAVFIAHHQRPAFSRLHHLDDSPAGQPVTRILGFPPAPPSPFQAERIFRTCSRARNRGFLVEVEVHVLGEIMDSSPKEGGRKADSSRALSAHALPVPEGDGSANIFICDRAARNFFEIRRTPGIPLQVVEILGRSALWGLDGVDGLHEIH